jgi:hypothetical protein
MPGDIRHRLEEMLNLNIQTLVTKNEDALVKPQSILELFLAVHKKFAQPCSIGNAIMVINQCLKVSPRNQINVTAIMDELCAHNIIEVISLQSSTGGGFKYYKLTNYGKQCAMFAKLMVSSPSRQDA